MGNERALHNMPRVRQLFKELAKAGPLTPDLTRKVNEMLTLTGSERLVENDNATALRSVGGEP
jgi:hypothetical protein